MSRSLHFIFPILFLFPWFRRRRRINRGNLFVLDDMRVNAKRQFDIRMPCHVLMFSKRSFSRSALAAIKQTNGVAPESAAQTTAVWQITVLPLPRGIAIAKKPPRKTACSILEIVLNQKNGIMNKVDPAVGREKVARLGDFCYLFRRDQPLGRHRQEFGKVFVLNAPSVATEPF